jgi:hypothetical protein
MEMTVDENAVNLFYYINTSDGDGFQHYTAVIGDNSARHQIKAIENDIDFSKWSYESRELIKKYFTDLTIRKPKKFKNGYRR